MEIEATEVVKVNAKTLKVYLKVSDRFTAQLFSESGSLVHQQDDGYVPQFMPDEHYGDYVFLNIDIDTGQITNWKQPTAEQIQDWIDPKEE